MKKLFISAVIALSLLTANAYAALTVSNVVRTKTSNKFVITGTATFDSSYESGGEVLSAGVLGLSTIDTIVVDGDLNGYGVQASVASNKQSAVLSLFAQGAGSNSLLGQSVFIKHDASASSNGVQVYASSNDGINGWLQFQSPTSTSGSGLITTSGPSYYVKHSSTPSTDAFELRFDEDATVANDRVQSVAKSDYYVSLSDGQKVKVKAVTTTTGTVAVYFDEDATVTSQRLLFVSPTTLDGTARATRGVGVELAAGADASALSVNFVVLGN